MYLIKILDTRQDGRFCVILCIWPLKLNNKLQKITQYDTVALDVTVSAQPETASGAYEYRLA